MGLDKLPEILTVKQLAEFLQISDQTIARAVKSGDLKGFKVGREWRFEKEKVLEWLNAKK